MLTEILPFGLMTVLGTPSTTGNQQEQRRQLRQSQRFERQPKTKVRLKDKVLLLHKTSPSRLGEVAVLSKAQNPTERVKKKKKKKKKKKQKNMFQTKEEEKSPKTDLNEMEINDLPDKVFNVMVIMMFNKVRRKMYKQIENFNKDIKNIKEHQI